MLINKLIWDGTEHVEWILNDGSTLKRIWKYHPKSVILLSDRTGIMVIEAVEESGPTNLLVINSDGSERMRPSLPTNYGHTYGFIYGGI